MDGQQTIERADGSSTPEVVEAVPYVGLTNVETDPVYALLRSVDGQPDGSALLTVDPLSIAKGSSAGGCQRWGFTTPLGDFCLANVTKRDRLVTLIPGAEVGAGDGTITADGLSAFLTDSANFRTSALVMVRLNEDGYVTSIVGLDAREAQTPPIAGSGDEWSSRVRRLLASAEGGPWANSDVRCDVPAGYVPWTEYACTSIDEFGGELLVPFFIVVTPDGVDFIVTVGDRSYQSGQWGA